MVSKITITVLIPLYQYTYNIIDATIRDLQLIFPEWLLNIENTSILKDILFTYIKQELFIVLAMN